MRSKVIVSKFGGTSLGDAKCMIRSAEIVLQRDAAVVVVSATAGTTNSLVHLAKTALSGETEKLVEYFEQISANHKKIAENLRASHEYGFKRSAAREETITQSYG
jgi:aspartate kinase